MNLAISLHTQAFNTQCAHRQSSSMVGFNRPKLFTTECFVDTRKLSHAEWLEIRRQAIGSSDCAAACGVNPYMSILELWMIKTGRVQQNIEAQREYASLLWDKQLESSIADFYCTHTEKNVQHMNAVLQHRDLDKHFMLANLDYSVIGSDEVQVLNCIATGKYEAKRWSDGVPLYVLCQVQHQLEVTGKQAAHICVLLCGQETRIFKVTRSESMIQTIVEAERYFWDCVENDIPPDVTISESIANELQQLYP